MGEALPGRAVERRLVFERCVLVERRGVGLAQLDQPVRERVEQELEVAVRLFRVLALGGVVRPLCLAGLGQRLGLVLGEQVELTPDETGEAIAAQKAQRSSR